VQHAEQPASVDRDLRPAVTGRQAAGLAPDPLPVLGVEHILGGGDARCQQVIEQPEFGQLAHRMGQDVDADAQLPDGRCRLVNVHVVDAGIKQGQGQRHATDATARDCDLHNRPPRPTTSGGAKGKNPTRAAPRAAAQFHVFAEGGEAVCRGG
jgi:hypothetical protein